MSNNHRDPYEMLLSEAKIGWQYNMLMQRTHYNIAEMFTERRMLEGAVKHQKVAAISYKNACRWRDSYNDILIESQQGA